MGSMLVSSCRCCMGVSCVHPVAILKALFCMSCSLSVFVGEIVGDQIVDAYSRMGRVMALYVCSSVSLCWPHLDAVMACMMLRVRLAFSHVSWMCLVKVCCESKVMPRILLWLVVGIVLLSIWMLSFYLSSSMHL